MAWLALEPGRLLEPASDCRPRGMAATPLGRTEPGLQVGSPICQKGRLRAAFLLFVVCSGGLNVCGGCHLQRLFKLLLVGI